MRLTQFLFFFMLERFFFVVVFNGYGVLLPWSFRVIQFGSSILELIEALNSFVLCFKLNLTSF